MANPIAITVIKTKEVTANIEIIYMKTKMYMAVVFGFAFCRRECTLKSEILFLTDMIVFSL